MDIQQYFTHRPDYSREFTERVRALADDISSAVGVPVKHQSDMNYSVGQQIRIYLTDDGLPIPDEPVASLALSVAISSKGPLYTLLAWHKRQEPSGWFPIAPDEVLSASRTGKVADAVHRVMRKAGLSRVPEQVLDQLVPGQVTDMDGAPATVRDVLFCEVC